MTMAVFKSRKEMEEIFGEMWNHAIQNTRLGRELKENNISILFKMTDPDMTMFVDEGGAVFAKAAEARTAVITGRMSGDTAHKFWLNKLQMASALATDQIRARGSATKLIQLLPLFRFVQEAYPAVCRKHNIPLE